MSDRYPSDFFNNTFKHFMMALFHSELADLSRYQHWEVIRFKEMQQRCNEKAKKILSDHPVTSTSETVLAGIAEILDRQETLGN
jgi:trimethylamine:corrinoid methyltransferase-like protein